MSDLRPIAIYLPQFHPIPENDAWWGKGFTEWTNVVKARPRFKGHYQPHLPADLGFYDLRLPEVREAQAALAKEYGIHGFCYYHYWFNGKRVLERPFQDVLASGKPDFPFCLCWANENWTRRWDGWEQEILLAQQHSSADDRLHMQFLAPAFQDPRYIRIDGRPLFIVYRTELFPSIRQTAEIWREEARRQGVGEIYLARVESFVSGVAPSEIGFDAAVDLQPSWTELPTQEFGSRLDRLLHRLRINASPFANNKILDYQKVVHRMQHRATPPYKRFPGVTPMWDNSARRKAGATILQNSTPESYEGWLTNVLRNFKPHSAEENLVFINAWNEWAEGNHLEPCQKWGRAYLEATRNALAFPKTE